MPAVVKKLCQIGGFLLLVSMLFVLCSVWSYTPTDPTWNQYVSGQVAVVSNLGGVVGAVLADWGLQALGSTVTLLVGIGALSAWFVMWRRLRMAVAVVWRGMVLLAAVSMLGQLLWRHDPFFGAEVQTGGVSGQWLVGTSVKYLNPFGTYIVIAAAAVLALLVGVEHTALYGRIRSCVAAIGMRCRALGQRVASLWYRVCAPVRGIVGIFRRKQVSRQQDAERRMAQRTRLLHTATHETDDASATTPLAVAAHPVDEEPLVAPLVTVLNAESQAYPDDDALVIPSPAVPRRRKKRKSRMSSGLPAVDLLDVPDTPQHGVPQAELEEQGRFLEGKLRDFGVEGEVVQVLPGPVITMYEYAPASGVKVNKIVNLQDDLALVMRALSVRVVAPIPGKAVVGIEIPNVHRETVRLRDILESGALETLGSKLSLALGKDIFGKPMVTDLALIPHLLIAGATGSGKSVGLNSMICSLLFRATPADVRMIMIDPKMLELSIYEGLPHLLIPVVTNPKQAALALRRVVEEMERRYQLLAARGVRSIAQYNQLIDEEAAQPSGHATREYEAHEDEDIASLFPAEKLPYLVVVIDELSDLMMVSSREVEDALTRIAQMARAAGIHLIVATQRPSVDVLTGVIKANFPARISFQVTSKTDSRTILDANGAEKLLGRGDMLFLAPGTSKAQRVHSAYVSEAEINRLVDAWKELDQPNYDESFLVPADESPEMGEQEYDEKYDEAVALVARTGQASISMLQRRLRVGYNRAARMIEVMENEGVIGPADGVKPREVLMRNTYDDI